MTKPRQHPFIACANGHRRETRRLCVVVSTDVSAFRRFEASTDVSTIRRSGLFGSGAGYCQKIVNPGEYTWGTRAFRRFGLSGSGARYYQKIVNPGEYTWGTRASTRRLTFRRVRLSGSGAGRYQKIVNPGEYTWGTRNCSVAAIGAIHGPVRGFSSTRAGPL